MSLLAFSLAGESQAFCVRANLLGLRLRCIRQVLVGLLEMPDRMDWRACMLSEDEDKADAQAFKNAFVPFDPTR